MDRRQAVLLLKAKMMNGTRNRDQSRHAAAADTLVPRGPVCVSSRHTLRRLDLPHCPAAFNICRDEPEAYLRMPANAIWREGHTTIISDFGQVWAVVSMEEAIKTMGLKI